MTVVFKNKCTIAKGCFLADIFLRKFPTFSSIFRICDVFVMTAVNSVILIMSP